MHSSRPSFLPKPLNFAPRTAIIAVGLASTILFMQTGRAVAVEIPSVTLSPSPAAPFIGTGTTIAVTFQNTAANQKLGYGLLSQRGKDERQRSRVSRQREARNENRERERQQREDRRGPGGPKATAGERRHNDAQQQRAECHRHREVPCCGVRAVFLDMRRPVSTRQAGGKCQDGDHRQCGDGCPRHKGHCRCTRLCGAASRVFERQHAVA